MDVRPLLRVLGAAGSLQQQLCKSPGGTGAQGGEREARWGSRCGWLWRTQSEAAMSRRDGSPARSGSRPCPGSAGLDAVLHRTLLPNSYVLSSRGEKKLLQGPLLPPPAANQPPPPQCCKLSTKQVASFRPAFSDCHFSSCAGLVWNGAAESGSEQASRWWCFGRCASAPSPCRAAAARAGAAADADSTPGRERPGGSGIQGGIRGSAKQQGRWGRSLTTGDGA